MGVKVPTRVGGGETPGRSSHSKRLGSPPRLEGKEAGSQAPRVESREGGDGEDCPRPVPPVCSEFMGLRKDMETESQ